MGWLVRLKGSREYDVNQRRNEGLPEMQRAKQCGHYYSRYLVIIPCPTYTNIENTHIL
jgi:hypothetical protein